ncbi:cyclin-D3-2 [Rhodamnia argentea]|uniref:Cyclin-D3-2 n=1 Tax=Rhodamnia argentea TaxID=178133 RepID=A0A8B8PBD2_9MYRT|nr:cyclin-D3-2 [Rhodamnia argentea]
MALQEDETHHQYSNASFSLDGLYCEDETFDEDLADNAGGNACEEAGDDLYEIKDSTLPLSLLEQDLFWEDGELASLVSRETETHPRCDELISDGSAALARKEAVGWILRGRAHHGFRPLTAMLAVNYFDRFILSFRYQRDRPWINQLVAVACLSVAAKVEETQVPLLLDLQVADAKYVFQSRTIQRMELLVMSTLGWRMNSVTPISFFDHLLRRFALTTNLHRQFFWMSERLLLSLVADARLASFLPSVVARATMLYVNREIEPCICGEFLDQLLSVLKINEDQVNECYELILELSTDHPEILNYKHKPKKLSVASSPSGVIDASFSCDSSNDLWGVASSVSSLPEPRFKRSRYQDQQMGLPSASVSPMGVLNSSY